MSLLNLVGVSLEAVDPSPKTIGRLLKVARRLLENARRGPRWLRPASRPRSSPSRTVLITLPIETATKAALFKAVAASGTSRMALAKAVGLDEKEIRRMLDPRHSFKLPRLARVLKALGKELRVTVVDAPKPPVARESHAVYRAAAKRRRTGGSRK